jgi:DNA-binding GntR family transcriptional regulator
MGQPDIPEQSQGNVAYAKLMAAIATGAFQPGDRLREADVATRLCLSRTPVREALRRMEAEAIIEHRPRIGAVIRVLSQTEVVELYEMRVVLERTAAELAAKHAVEAEVDTLRALNTEMALAVNAPARAATLNQQFHQCLYTATRNRFLLESARALNNVLLLLGPTTLADSERLKQVCTQHEAIIAAIAAGDATAAGQAAETHLQTSLRRRLAVMHP